MIPWKITLFWIQIEQYLQKLLGLWIQGLEKLHECMSYTVELSFEINLISQWRMIKAKRRRIYLSHLRFSSSSCVLLIFIHPVHSYLSQLILSSLHLITFKPALNQSIFTSIIYWAEAIHFCKFASFSMKSAKDASSTEGIDPDTSAAFATTTGSSFLAPEGIMRTRVMRPVYPARISPETMQGRRRLGQEIITDSFQIQFHRSDDEIKPTTKNGLYSKNTAY